MIKKYGFCFLLFSYLSSLTATDINFNGFMSVIGGITFDEEDSLYGYDDDFTFEQESIAALQANARLGDGLSATTQIVAKGSENFDTSFDWAYLSFDVNDKVRVNAGRIRIPFFRYSDFLEVGYAYPWLRPPQSVYEFPFSEYDGASLNYVSYLGDWDSELQIIYGRTKDNISFGAADLINSTGFAWTMTYDWFSYRLAYFQTEVKSVDSLIIASLAGIPGLELIEKKPVFAGMSLKADYENWLIEFEYTIIDGDESILGDQDSWFVSLGYRAGDLTYFIVTEDLENEVDYVLPAGLSALDAEFINLIAASVVEENTVYSAGLRYDFHPSAAFKVQYTSFENDLNDTDADLVAFGVDLVF